jgi:hypothetical protein
MANYLDGMDGGKHDSTQTETKTNSFTIKLVFEDIVSKNPLTATQKIVKWIKDDVDSMIFEVTNELTGESFTVDLSEDDDDVKVLPN